jgi:hypothetical protein
LTSVRFDILLIQKHAFLDLEVDTTTMQLFNRTRKAEKRWHKKALFLNSSKTRVVLVATARPKPKKTNTVLVESPKSGYMPPWMYKGNSQILDARLTWNEQLRRALADMFGA